MIAAFVFGIVSKEYQYILTDHVKVENNLNGERQEYCCNYVDGSGLN